MTQLGHDLQDNDCAPEINQLTRRRHQIAACHHTHISNGPTENQNGPIKRIKRVGFGFTNFNNYRLRLLPYAGRPNWDLLATLTPQPR